MDWTKSMNQTFDFYLVDPVTWQDKELLTNISSASIEKSLSNTMISSASISIDSELAECYIRIYLRVTQDGDEDRYALGTFMVQTPSVSFDGKVTTTKLTAYSPLIELKDQLPPLGYTIPKTTKIMELVSDLTDELVRAPVVKTSTEDQIVSNFTANTDDSWLTYLSSIMSYAKYSYFLDEFGRILFRPEQRYETLKPIWTFDDSNSSILAPSVSIERDLYGIPNVLEVNATLATGPYTYILYNNDHNCPISIPRRGRKVVKRITNPEIPGTLNESIIQEYAKEELIKLSSIDYTITYTHGYCPVNIGDCVLLDYKKAGLERVKAKVISQSLECATSCQVSETAIYSHSLVDETKLSADGPLYEL